MQTINGHEIPTDADGRVNLTEIWKRSGNPNKKPAQFKRLKRVQKILEVMDWFARRGHGASTWADYLMAMDYADYVGLERPTPSAADLDAEWEEAKRQARQRHENDPEVQERAQARAKEQAAQEARWEEERQDRKQEWDQFLADIDEQIANRDAGEDWKGDSYDDDTTGEEWKSEAQEPKTIKLFFDFLDWNGIKIRASMN